MHLKSSLAALGIASIVATGLGAVPSVAASGNLVFICGTVIGDKEFITTADTDLPATLATGASAPVNVTAKVTIPDDVRNAVYTFFGARKVAGTAKIQATQNDVHADRRRHLRPQGRQLHRVPGLHEGGRLRCLHRGRELHAEADHPGAGPHRRHRHRG